MATKKLFWEDPSRTECTATITSINGKKVKVDKTVFYAFSGGQESDSGTIGGITVVEAVKEGDKENIIDIEYELEEEPTFKVGDEVEIKIDGEKRANLRKLHSAAHILYYITIDRLGKVKIVGSNISPHKGRMDFNYDESLSEILPKLEEDMNKLVEEDHKIRMEDDAEKPDLQWWNCQDWRMPCGGTHAASTRDIGKVRLKTVTKGKGRKRIEIYLQE
jgi:alanyl-tRNA synthetase